tara:strand:+ start:2470 stop:2892 length:423 start_codon:yes stop_codon:yes gene_type:complete
LFNRPRILEILYIISKKILNFFSPLLKKRLLTEKIFVATEKVSKGLLFNCQMCGQCILHSTGMICPMNCPKNLRNGPCGGVRNNGNCEIKPEMRCVWLKAWNESQKMKVFSKDILTIQKPLDRRLQNTSAWLNEINTTSK